MRRRTRATTYPQPDRRHHIPNQLAGVPINEKAVANATIAVSDRIRSADGSWTDGPTTFYELTVWGGPAAGFAASAKKGVRLVAAGTLEVSEYTDSEGNTRRRRRITAEHVGTSTRFTPTSTATH